MRTVVEQSPENIAVMDVFSKLIQKRIIFIDDGIDADLANAVIAQMLFLDSQSHEPIHVYINSPGGNIIDGLAIYDVANLLTSPIRTVCVGMAASMAAILMLVGKDRCGLKHSRIMFHQPSGASIGTIQDHRITMKEMELLEKQLYDIVKEKTTLEDVENLFKFDYWMGSEEALEKKVLTEIKS